MKEYKCREREEGGGPSRDDWTTSGMTRKSTSAGKEKTSAGKEKKRGGPSRDDMKEYKSGMRRKSTEMTGLHQGSTKKGEAQEEMTEEVQGKRRRGRPK